MTVLAVNGVAVIAEKPVPMRHSFKGLPQNFRRIAKLLLANGDEVFACLVDGCEYTSPADQPVERVMQHLGKAHPEGKVRRGAADAGPPADLRDLPLREVYRLAQLGLQASTKIAEWRGRAVAAEKRLEDGRRAFLGEAGTK